VFKISPTVTMWVSFAVALASGISGGTVHLTNMVPSEWIPYITAWSSFFAFAGSTGVGLMAGMSSTQRGPLAPPPTIQEANAVLQEARKST
jgi:hypothetical protein